MLVPDSATPLYLQLEEILRQELRNCARRGWWCATQARALL